MFTLIWAIQSQTLFFDFLLIRREFAAFFCICFIFFLLPVPPFFLSFQNKKKKIKNSVYIRPWDDETLSMAYDVLLDELFLPPSAPGGKVEFRRSLTLSFLFRFNLEVLQKLREMVGDCSDCLFFSCEIHPKHLQRLPVCRMSLQMSFLTRSILYLERSNPACRSSRSQIPLIL